MNAKQIINVADANALYHKIKGLLPTKGTAIIGLVYRNNDLTESKLNLLIGGKHEEIARKRGLKVKTRDEWDASNISAYREGFFVFNEGGQPALEGFLMNQEKSKCGIKVSTVLAFKWMVSLTYKGITYAPEFVAKRTSRARIVQVRNGFTKIKKPNGDKYICRCVLGEPGDNLNYSAEKQSYKNFETGAVIHEKFLISKGTPEYIAAKKEMNTVAEKKEQAIAPKAALPSNRVFLKEGVPFKVTPGYWEKKKSQVGKSVFNS